ncbi:V-type ATP synthase subunit I [Spirochaetia bacterium]|nr:V-type ATP synthase subunit I [Spirochaetia bacterium]
MIVPMKKVSLVVMDKTREDSLAKLRELGVLHLERCTVSSDGLSKLQDRKTRAETALALLRAYQDPKKSAGKNARNRDDNAGGVTDADLVKVVLDLADEKKTLQEQLVSNAKERSRIEKWGNFNPASLGELAGAGITLIPYELLVKDYEALGSDQRFITLNRSKTSVYGVAVGTEISGSTPFALPDRSLAEIDAAVAGIGQRLSAIEKEFTGLGLRVQVIEKALKTLGEEIEFETAKVSMETAEDVPAEMTFSWITGFAPHDLVGVLKRAATENGWALVADDPGPDDNVPTKLKNNRLASLIYPLTNFLEVVPGYREVDISGWFLLFFCIFFGMIFGDAAYGAIILLAALIGIIKTAKKGVPPMLKLLLLLGLSNFTWGVLTCTWFGLETDKLPELLTRLALPLISTAGASVVGLFGTYSTANAAQAGAIIQQNLMIFCFSLALLQLSIGHVIAIVNTKSLKILGDIGSIAMLAGMYCIILSLIASNEYSKIPMSMPMVYVFAGGFVFNFMFANYDGSLGRSILESCKNIISVILGIANVFSDIMSYIRLWAVGLAGGAIASTVDAMAGPMLGHFIFFIFGVVLLVFGHGLNLVLNVLSVLVHGVRLNTLEFSGHAGLAWSGSAYKPFAKRIK